MTDQIVRVNTARVALADAAAASVIDDAVLAAVFAPDSATTDAAIRAADACDRARAALADAADALATLHVAAHRVTQGSNSGCFWSTLATDAADSLATTDAVCATLTDATDALAPLVNTTITPQEENS